MAFIGGASSFIESTLGQTFKVRDAEGFRLKAYRDSVGATRAFAHGMHGTQEGDPAKAAAAVAKALAAERMPLRLQLGADAVEAVRGHAQQLLADLREWEAVALDTRIEAMGAQPSEAAFA